jgi:hypothetical protein
MLWKVVANKLCVLVSKPNVMDDIKCIWELDDEPYCAFQISKAKGTFIIMNKFVTHSLEDVGRGELFGFQPCN